MQSLKRRYRSLPLYGQIALLGALLTAFHFSNHPALLVIEALSLVLLCYLRLDAGLLLAVACIPAANLYKHLGPDLYTPLEIIVLACTVAWAAGHGSRFKVQGSRFAHHAPRFTLHAPRFTLHAPRFTLHAPRLTALDFAVLALVAAATLSLLTAADLPAAQWSLRILVIEPALLYLMIRTAPPTPAPDDGTAVVRSDAHAGCDATADEKRPPGLEALAGLWVSGRNRLKPLFRHHKAILRADAHAAAAATADENVIARSVLCDEAISPDAKDCFGPNGGPRNDTSAAVFRAESQGVRPLHLADALILGAVAVSLIGLTQFAFTDYVERVEGVRRILSIYDSPNHLGLFLGRVIPIIVATVAFAANRRRRIGYALALLPIAAATYLTFSRGAWLVGLPAGLLAIAVLHGRRARIAVLGLLILVLLALLPFASTPRFASLFDLQGGTSLNRLLIWQGSLRMIAAHPLWGVGIGNFVTQYGRYILPEAWREPVIYHSHNVLLDFWAMLGIPGVIALLGLVGACFRTGLTAYRRLADADQQALTLGLLASMTVFLGHGLVDTGYFLTDLAFLLMLTLGILARLSAASSPINHSGAS